MPKKSEKNSKELAYYITLFRLEGHQTWRAHVGGFEGAFAQEQVKWGGKGPKVTETKVLRVDRITGTVLEEKRSRGLLD